MFTGLIEEMGTMKRVETLAGGRRIWIAANRVIGGTKSGDSVSVNGCCLTVVGLGPDHFSAEVVPETLARSVLADLREGDPVNLERSLRLDDRLGGHLVQGHVDGVGVVASVVKEGESRRVTIRIPPDLTRFVAEKGSLAVDGTSLTVAACSSTACEVAYIPHTLAHTVAGLYAPGRRVNLEVDLVARYVARLLSREDATSTPE